MIQLLTPDQLSLTRAPAHNFFLESGIEGDLDFDWFCEQWSNYIALDIAAVMLYFDRNNSASGIIGGTITPCSMTHDLIAVEAFWWVDPSLRGGPTGLRLLTAWEKQVVKMGAVRTYVGNLVGLNNDRMHSIYTRLKYRPIETHYVKTNAPQ